VFLSRARGLTAPRWLASARNFGDPLHVELLLEPEQASEHVCLTLRAVDGVGRASQDAPELCVDPSHDVAFAGACAAGTRRPGTLPAAPLSSLILAWAGLSWRRRRRARGPREERARGIGTLLPWGTLNALRRGGRGHRE